jgi:ADP-ribose pyrophosphatase YjhB (NUDIX family)
MVYTINPGQIEFPKDPNVIPGGSKFILPVGELKDGDGEELIYDGRPILDRKRQPKEKGIMLPLSIDGNPNGVKGDGSEVIIFNDLQLGQANKLLRFIDERFGSDVDPNTLTRDQINQIIDYAQKLGLKDIYPWDKKSVRDMMLPSPKEKYRILSDGSVFGACTRAPTKHYAVYIPGEVRLVGGSVTREPQQTAPGEKGAVLVKFRRPDGDWDIHLVQPSAFAKGYKILEGEDTRDIGAEDIEKLLPLQNLDWMLKDEAARRQVIAKINDWVKYSFSAAGKDPNEAFTEIGGNGVLVDGTWRKVYIIHAVDPIITDGKHVVLADRRFDPGSGLPAIPGGFRNRGESTINAAIREAKEETGLDLNNIEPVPVGYRAYNRSHSSSDIWSSDIRIAQGAKLEEEYGIKPGSIVVVSTQAMRFDVPDLAARQGELKKGPAGEDDKEEDVYDPRLVRIDSLPKVMAVSDHASLIHLTMAQLETEQYQLAMEKLPIDESASTDERRRIADERDRVTNEHLPVIRQELEAAGKSANYMNWTAILGGHVPSSSQIASLQRENARTVVSNAR